MMILKWQFINNIFTQEVDVDLEDDSEAITENDLQLICDLFYLPCEHGPEVNTQVIFGHFILWFWDKMHFI